MLRTAEKKDPSKGRSKGNHYRIFRQAVKAVSENQWDSFSVPYLAQYLKISERTLYRSFDHWVGVGPYEFFTLSRLHAFRRDLITGRPHRGKITQAAKANGFDELSRLANLYKRHFSELPSETVEKCRDRLDSAVG